MTRAAGDTLIIEGRGGRRVIDGAIRVSGSKNDAVQAIAAALLYRNSLTLTNLPAIADVQKMLILVGNLGCRVVRGKNKVTITAPESMTRTVLDNKTAAEIRASILLTGPILARYGRVGFPHPGGCVIGARPIDLFLAGFVKLGATARRSGRQRYLIAASPGGLGGAEIFFKNQSVTATETLLMTAVLARGRTTLKNCALEPEIVNLADHLIAAGAKISGAGTPTIVVRGGPLLVARWPYQILPDRIEAGSFAILGGLLAKSLKLTACRPDHLSALLDVLTEIGLRLEIAKTSVTIKAPAGRLRAVNIKTHEYPGLPTDLQAPLVVLLTQTAGASEIFETIFDGRLAYVETLKKMGAAIEVLDSRRLKISGPTRLRGRTVTSPDLRAGLAYLLAALVAKGRSLVHNVHYIDRGYEKIDERLRALGLAVWRR